MKRLRDGLALWAMVASLAACGEFQRAGDDHGDGGNTSASRASEHDDGGLSGAGPGSCGNLVCPLSCGAIFDDSGCVTGCNCEADPLDGATDHGAEGGTGSGGVGETSEPENPVGPSCPAGNCSELCIAEIDENGCLVACFCPPDRAEPPVEEPPVEEDPPDGVETPPEGETAPGTGNLALSEDCGPCPSGKSCIAHSAGGSVCVVEPGDEAKTAGAAPNLDCWAGPAPRETTGIRRVTVTACVTVFGLDADTSVTMLEITDQNNEPLGITARVSKVDASVCGNRGAYTAGNVPTNTQLRFRARDATCEGREEGCFGQFRETVAYNKYLPSDRISGDILDGAEARILEAIVIADNTFRLIPIVVGFPGGVWEPNGGIAGTIRDCDGERIENATVETRIPPSNGRTIYFNGDSESPQPDVSRWSSNVDGTYAILDIPPGMHDIAASARVGGKVLSAGAMRVGLPPNSVTIMVFDGWHP